MGMCNVYHHVFKAKSNFLGIMIPSSHTNGGTKKFSFKKPTSPRLSSDRLQNDDSNTIHENSEDHARAHF